MATKKNSAKTTTKKSTVKPAAKKATPAKVTVAKKTAPKKVVAKKTASPAKKVAPHKATPAKKTVVAKVAPKKAIAKKATPVPKKANVVKKATPTKKVVVKKTIPTKVKTGATKAKAATKKATIAKAPVRNTETKKVIAKPKEVSKKTTAVIKRKTEKIVNKKASKAVNVQQKVEGAPAKPARSKKHDIPVTPVLPARSEFADAIRQKPKSNVGKPGVVIAQRRLTKKGTKEEINVTMKEYNPTKRSLLDEPEQSSGPVYRYSDDELNEFRELIQKRLENAKRELSFLQGLITRKDEAGTEDTDNRFNHMEDGSGAMEREQLSQLAGRQIQFINNLEKALVRIENKTYGICRETGKLIDKARLRAVPHATLSIEAKNARK